MSVNWNLNRKESAKGADARRRTMKEPTDSSGCALDTAPGLRVFLGSELADAK